MHWIVVGDVHQNAAALARIPGVGQAQALIISGDMTNRGGAGQAQSVLEAALRANPRVLAQVGNMDEAGVDAHLSGLGVNIHRRAVLLAPGLALMGVGWSTPTPFGTPSEASETDMAAWLAETHAKALDLAGPDGHVLAVIHNAPHGTRLDLLPNGAHVGSTAVRSFLEAAQPAVCVCGHIHEARGEERLGRCHVLNPGMLSGGGFARVSLEHGAPAASLGQA